MRPIAVIRSLAAAFCSLCLAVGTASCQPAPNPDTARKGSELPPENAPGCPLALDLTIIDGQVPREWEEPSDMKDSTSRTIRAGEPVCLRLRFTNVGKEPLTIYRPDTSRGSVGIRLISPDGKAGRYVRPQVGRGFAPLDAVTLEPGQESYLETVMFATLDQGGGYRYVFDQQGQWSIDAVHAKGISAPVHVRSKPVFLTVGPPLDRWNDLWSAGIVGLIDNTETDYSKRAAARAALVAILGPGPSCFDPWIATPPRPFDAIVTKPDDQTTEGQARRLAGAYLQALDDCKADTFEPLIADDVVFNQNKDKARLLTDLRAQVATFDAAKLTIVVEKAEFKSTDPSRVLARLQVLAHDDAKGRDFRSFYHMVFEPRAGAWKIVYLDIQRSAR